MTKVWCWKCRWARLDAAPGSPAEDFSTHKMVMNVGSRPTLNEVGRKRAVSAVTACPLDACHYTRATNVSANPSCRLAGHMILQYLYQFKVTGGCTCTLTRVIHAGVIAPNLGAVTLQAQQSLPTSNAQIMVSLAGKHMTMCLIKGSSKQLCRSHELHCLCSMHLISSCQLARFAWHTKMARNAQRENPGSCCRLVTAFTAVAQGLCLGYHSHMYEYSTGLLLMQLYAALLKVSNELLTVSSSVAQNRICMCRSQFFSICHQTRVAMHGNGTGILFHTNTRPVVAV